MARSLRNSQKQQGQKIPTTVPGFSENEVMAAYNSVQGKSPKEMEEELFRVAAKEMQDGTFDPNQMDDFLKAVSPMLNPQQRERMASLIAMVKAQAKG